MYEFVSRGRSNLKLQDIFIDNLHSEAEIKQPRDHNHKFLITVQSLNIIARALSYIMPLSPDHIFRARNN